MISVSLVKMARSLSKGSISETLLSYNPCFSVRFSSDGNPNTIKPSHNSLNKKSIGSFERLVGYPSPLLGLRHFIGSELKQLPTLVQKLLASHHPVVAKSDLLLQSSNPLTPSQSLGLLTLLVSKAMNTLNPTLPDLDQFGITSSQRILAEVTEMINMAHTVHSEVVDINHVTTTRDEQAPVKDIEFGNKLLIIGGDLLLARACKELSLLYNPKVVGLISQAISDIMTGVCLREATPLCHPSHPSDPQSSSPSSQYASLTSDPIVIKSSDPVNKQSYSHLSPDPSSLISSDPTYPPPNSLYESYFHIGSLLSNSFRCCAIVAELDQVNQTLSADIGRQIAISQQAANDVLHSQEIQNSKKRENSLSTADESITKALHYLDFLPRSKSKDALTEIVCNMKIFIDSVS